MLATNIMRPTSCILGDRLFKTRNFIFSRLDSSIEQVEHQRSEHQTLCVEVTDYPTWVPDFAKRTHSTIYKEWIYACIKQSLSPIRFRWLRKSALWRVHLRSSQRVQCIILDCVQFGCVPVRVNGSTAVSEGLRLYLWLCDLAHRRLPTCCSFLLLCSLRLYGWVAEQDHEFEF